MRITTGSATLPMLALAGLAHAQATLHPQGLDTDAGRPAPAAERTEPITDAWWQDAVFYEVFVRSFADSTEGPLAGDGVGDLRGLIERLDYLNDGDPETRDDLGVTALWLMPVAESPSYHGYDTTDYRLIDADYGTNADFRALIDACEARGMRVIVDLVLNHCSSQHHWFEESARGNPAFRDWFIWRDQHPGWDGPWNQPVWHRVPGRSAGVGGGNPGDVYYGLFWSGMPDLNYENPAVTAEMFDVIRFWVEDMGAHGFRLDAIRHLIEDGQRQDNTPATHEWLRGFYQHVKSLGPDVLTVGEVWAPSDDVSRYVGDQMDIAFEFWLAEAIVQTAKAGTAEPFLTAWDEVAKLYPLGMYATFLRNHDQQRVLRALGEDREAAKLAAALQFALPGVPFIYYGEEIGMSADKPDPQLRTPMHWDAGPHAGFSSSDPWIEIKPDYATVNVERQRDDTGSLHTWYRALIEARRSHGALRIGELTILNTGDPGVLAFVRHKGDSAVLCLFNLTSQTIRLPEVTPPEGFAGDARLDTDLITGRVGASLSQPVPALAPREALYFPVRN